MPFFQKYKFRKVGINKSDDTIAWRCTAKKCAARLYTDQNCSKIIRSTIEHVNHEACSDQAVQKYIVKNCCKRKALEDISLRPRKIINSEICQSPTSGMVYNDLNNIRLSMYRTRRKILPKIPKC